MYFRFFFLFLFLFLGVLNSSELLNKKEKEYLLKNNTFTVCSQYDVYPLVAVRDGSLVGIAAEIFSKFEQKLNIKFQAIDVKSDQDLDIKVSQNRCDFVAIIGTDQKRFKNIQSSKVMYKDYLTSIGNLKSSFIDNKTDFSKHKFFVRYKVHEQKVKKSYPDLDIQNIYNIDTIMNKLKNNHNFHLISPRLMNETYIQKYGFDKYKQNGIFENIENETSVGINKNNPMMISIINKTIDSLGKEYFNTIKNKYVLKEFTVENSYNIYFLLFSFLLVVLLLYVYLKKQQIQKAHKVILEQRKREKKLQRQLLEAQKIAHLGMWEFNLVSNQLEWTDEVYNILEKDKSKFKPTYESFLEIVHPDDRALLEESYITSLKTKKPYSIVHRVQMADGGIKYLKEECKTKFDTDGNATLSQGTIQDITQEYKLQKEAIYEKNFISTIINSANAVIVTIDGDGTMIRVNKYTEEFTGYTKEQIASEPYFWFNFLPEYKKDDIDKMMEGARAGKIAKSYKNSWISKDGVEKVFEWSNALVQKKDGSLDYITTIGVDVTEKEKFQEKIESQKKEFESIFKYAHDGIAIIDLQSNFLNFNDAFLNLTGYTKRELLSSSCMELTVEEDKEKNKIAIEHAIQKGQYENIVKRCTRADGNTITVNMSISLLPDQDRLILVLTDITSLKMIEEQTRLASMGEMIGNIAHQWRQPLSVISTAATGMKMQKEFNALDDASFSKTCDLINDNAQYLSKTIDDFKNFIKGDTEAVVFNLQNSTNSFIHLLDSSIKTHNIDVVLNLEEHAEVKGFPNELIQCFINIFNNSKDALLNNNIDENERYVFISQCVKDNEIVIIFKDNAGGIPENVLPHIFEPYFTTKHKSQGTGLGLNMTYKLIVEGMRGTITASNVSYSYNNKEYKGAKFEIKIPLK